MSHILPPASGDSLVALGRSSSEPNKYDVDSDFETELISLTEAVESAARPGAKRRVRVETAVSASKAAKVAKRENATSIPSPLTSNTGENRASHGQPLVAIDTHRPYAHAREFKQHRYAKQLLKEYLELRQRDVVVWHSCPRGDREFPPFCHGSNCYKYSELLVLRGGERVVLEYRDPDGKWVADLAVLDEHGKRRFIVEVKAANPVTAERPEPWFEVGARDIIKMKGKRMELEELREEHPRICGDCKRTEEPWALRIPTIPVGERANTPCLFCGRYGYSLLWIANRPRQVCKICFGNDTETVKARFAC